MINSSPFYFNQIIKELKKNCKNLNYNDLMVFNELYFRFNISPILTIDNETLSRELDLSVSTIKRAIKELSKLKIIIIKTRYILELNKNKREIVKGQIEHLVRIKTPDKSIKKHYKYDKKVDIKAKGQKEPIINKYINNINYDENSKINQLKRDYFDKKISFREYLKVVKSIKKHYDIIDLVKNSNEE